MSMFISMVYPDAVRLLTDGATYGLDGTLTKIGRKVHAHDALPIALTGRGSTEMIENIRDVLFAVASERGTVDGFIEALQGTIDAIREKIDGRIHETQHCELLIAMWSETTGGQQRYFITKDFPTREIRKFTVFTPGWFIDAAPPVSGDDFDLVRRWIIEDGQEFAIRHGAVAGEIWRRTPDSHPSNPKGPTSFLVGGQLDLTVISRKGVSVQTLRTWDDRIGERIDPFHPRHAAQFAGMSRQQRRALERQAKRRLS